MSISRRDLFRGALRRSRDVAVNMAKAVRRDRSLDILQRPPGAVAEGQFLGGCTRCGDCIDVCPPQAIRVADASFGPRLEGTPYIEAIEQACVMCIDMPCINACEPGVLRHDTPVNMADVSINEGGCLSWQGEKCTLCADVCPVEDAIVLDPGGRPRIDPSTCTGCGSCLQVCPVGTAGVTLTPVEARPFCPLD
jgi:ferredoxin-type protein NapG